MCNEDKKGHIVDIIYDGCTGTVNIHEGGGFDIKFNVNHQFLYDNYKEYPVRNSLSKTTGGNAHKFVCNDGKDDCSGLEPQ